MTHVLIKYGLLGLFVFFLWLNRSYFSWTEIVWLTRLCSKPAVTVPPLWRRQDKQRRLQRFQAICSTQNCGRVSCVTFPENVSTFRYLWTAI